MLMTVPAGVELQPVQEEPAPAGRIGAAVRAAGSISLINSRTLLIVYSALPLFAGRRKRPVLRSLAAVILVSGKSDSNAKDTAAAYWGSQLARKSRAKQVRFGGPAVLGYARRPETLRPWLSSGVPLSNVRASSHGGAKAVNERWTRCNILLSPFWPSAVSRHQEDIPKLSPASFDNPGCGYHHRIRLQQEQIRPAHGNGQPGARKVP